MRRIVPALLVLLVWLVGVGPLGQFTGKLGEVQQQDGAAFLPASAESTQVAALRKGFEDSETVPAILLWESATPLPPDAVDGVLDRLKPLGAGPVIGPIASEDGKALQVVLPVPPETEGLVDKIKETAAVPGTTLYVAGPAALGEDLSGAFAGIDGILLMVALGVVLLILLAVYRSVVLPLIVIVGAVLALALASALVYLLAKHDVLQLNGQTQGIMFILVVGAATDYALLMAVRFREELGRTEGDSWPALRTAWRRSAGPITASAFTVVAGLLTLLLSDLNSNKSLGPVAAIGVGCALISALTFLPAALALFGRKAFWPSRALDRKQVVWHKTAGLVARHPRRIWVTTVLALGVLAAFAPTLKADGIPQTEVFLSEKPSAVAQRAVARHFPGGAGNPLFVVAPAAQAQTVQAQAKVAGVSEVQPVTEGDAPKVVDGRVAFRATLADEPDSDAALATVARMRAALDGAGQVGGYSATEYDTRKAAEHDRTLIIPIVLLVIVLILAVLLRAIAAPLLLVATVVLSYAATLGVSALVFTHLFGFAGSDPSVPLFGFVFLVALGVDYNVFLMSRVREESKIHGTREGVLRGLIATGGVITSAGVVLAATFGALAVIPLVFLVQIAFTVAFGVLLDAVLVRSLLVPALVREIGDRIWWPGKLRSREAVNPPDASGTPAAPSANP